MRPSHRIVEEERLEHRSPSDDHATQVETLEERAAKRVQPLAVLLDRGDTEACANSTAVEEELVQLGQRALVKYLAKDQWQVCVRPRKTKSSACASTSTSDESALATELL